MPRKYQQQGTIEEIALGIGHCSRSNEKSQKVQTKRSRDIHVIDAAVVIGCQVSIFVDKPIAELP